MIDLSRYPTRLCRGPHCGAMVRFLPSPSGKMLIVNAAPGKGVILNASGYGEVVDTFTPHHATCPDVALFREQQGNPGGKP